MVSSRMQGVRWAPPRRARRRGGDRCQWRNDHSRLGRIAFSRLFLPHPDAGGSYQVIDNVDDAVRVVAEQIARPTIIVGHLSETKDNLVQIVYPVWHQRVRLLLSGSHVRGGSAVAGADPLCRGRLRFVGGGSAVDIRLLRISLKL